MHARYFVNKFGQVKTTLLKNYTWQTLRIVQYISTKYQFACIIFLSVHCKNKSVYFVPKECSL